MVATAQEVAGRGVVESLLVLGIECWIQTVHSTAPKVVAAVFDTGSFVLQLVSAEKKRKMIRPFLSCRIYHNHLRLYDRCHHIAPQSLGHRHHSERVNSLGGKQHLEKRS